MISYFLLKLYLLILMQQCFWMFVWSLVCRVAALMLLHNALTYIWSPKPVCRFFVRDVYLGSRRGLSQTSLWCALRSIPAYWGSTLQGLRSSAWFLSRVSYRPQRALPVLSDFTQSKLGALYSESRVSPENFQMYLCCSCFTAVACYGYSGAECEGSSPWVWKENKRHHG